MVQIDGLSGTGKSTLCAELAQRGYRAVDADAEFGYFGDPVTGLPSDVDSRANWIWNGNKLRAFAAGSHDALVFICGGAMNQDEFADLFAKRFVLRIDSETMRHRLLTRTNNDFGKDPADLAEQLELNMHVVKEAKRIGSVVVDATRPINEVADDIVRTWTNPLLDGHRAVGMAGMPMPLGSYVERQLAQASTPRSVLAELVHRAVGTGIDRVDRIVEGYSNEVYRVRCADEQDVVVRILRFDDEDLAASSAGEAGAIERARAAGVPAPEILLLDTVRIDGSEFPVMVQRTVPGRPLGEVVNRLSERQRHDVLAEIGGLTARINGIQADDERDWPTAMAADLADRHAGRDKILAGGFSAPQFDRMLDLLEGYVRDFPCEQWVLCHGDLSLKHIFVTGDGGDGAAVRVSGIIDFGDWRPGAPVHDLAVLRVRDPRLDLAPLLAGYGAPTDVTYRRRLDLHTLIIALCSLEFGVNEDDQACIERSGHLIRSLVADLDDPDV